MENGNCIVANVRKCVLMNICLFVGRAQHNYSDIYMFSFILYGIIEYESQLLSVDATKMIYIFQHIQSQSSSNSMDIVYQF